MYLSVNQFEDKSASLNSIDMLIKAGFPFEAEELFFKIHSLDLNNLRSQLLEEAKEGEEFISSETKVISFFERVLDTVSEIAESLRRTYIFKTNERTNSGIFSNWLVQQVTISVNEAISLLADDLLTSARKMQSLYRRLLVAFGNYDIKGICCSFVLDKAFTE